jgi:hypothetical protein
MKAGAVIIVKETGQLGIVEAIEPKNTWPTDWLEDVLVVRSSRRTIRCFKRSEVTQFYCPREKVASTK